MKTSSNRFPRVNCRADARPRVHIIAAALLLCCLHAFADTGGALVLEHANTNENIIDNATGDFISFLRGSVAFRFDDVRITSEEATWRRKDGIVDFKTNVKVEQQGQVMTCDQLHFVRDKNVLTAIGNVRYSDSAKITFMRGETAEYATNKKECVLRGEPLLTRADTAGVDTLFISGRVMVYNDSTKIATVSSNVEINRGSLVATGERAIYFVSDNIAHLRRDPVINYEKHKIVGDSVNLFFGEESLEGACVTGNVHGFYSEIADSSADTTVMNIYSDSLGLAMFESGDIKSIKAFGNARGDFTEMPAGPKPPTTTYISSDSLHVFMFETGKVSSMKAYGDARGRYTEDAAEPGGAVTATHISSDSLHMFMFENGKVNSMKAYGDARGKYTEITEAQSVTATDITSDSMHVFMFETGKISAMKAFGKAHGRSAEWSATSSAKDSSITHIWSDSLRVTMSDNGKVGTMRAFNNVRSQNFTVGDSARLNEVEGQRMTLAFGETGKIERAIVRGNAKSRYFVEESDGGGCNVASGDQIIVIFSHGKAQRLRVRGNAKGIYFP